MRQRTATFSTVPLARVMRRVRSCCGLRFGPRPTTSYVSVPSSFSASAEAPALNWSGSTPIPTRFERWMRSKLCATTALTPSSAVPFAAQSRELPVPYSCPAITTSGTRSCWYFIAAKGTALLGVRAVVAQSFERIHRSNLVGMGVLPLQFEEGASALALKLDGTETYDVAGLGPDLKPRQDLMLRITRANGSVEAISVRCRIDTPIEIDYYQHGGILPYVLRQLVAQA